MDQGHGTPGFHSTLRRKLTSLVSRTGNHSRKNRTPHGSDAPDVIAHLSLDIAKWQSMDFLAMLLLVEQLREMTEIDRFDSKERRGQAGLAVKPLIEILTFAYSDQIGQETRGSGASDSNEKGSSTSSAKVTPATDPTLVTVVIQVLLCLRYITKGDAANIEAATSHGAAQVCKNIMVKYSANSLIQRNCYMVFRSLTFNRADNQRYIVQQLDVVPLVCRSMTRFAENTSLQASAFMFIQNITWLVEENRQIVELEGGIALILTAMKNKPESLEIQKWGCGALQNLACNIECTVKLIRTGVLEVVLKAMTAFPRDCIVQNYGLGVMRNLSFMKDHRLEVAKTGAIGLALRAMRNHPSSLEVQSSACSFIFNVIIEVDANRLLLLQSPEALDLFFDSMAHHSDDTRFVEKCNYLLDQLASGNPHSCYVAPELSVEPYSLLELAARQLARERKTMAGIAVGFLPSVFKMVESAKECPECTQQYVSNYAVAIKSKPVCWTLTRVCSRRCVGTMTRRCVVCLCTCTYV
ncbi:hypothetical protein, variant [Sphaeroforma arctica JP610]|uniref:Armadillo repeat-containing domain-containing protein n=1 Tax=Sphaeroforma arctica JP610 TaxID=667725 RepID=A0A0L0GBT0_9EUKA|nr:hypothetical protein, variant [Sphaeroforma arctica JP610]KNC86472.1 hypothetical protein, variant [Sphaeroforma arctica JP610]|eukprot:XP_014160375.1 hypothetical protein, variant [Sphaeroforma arctica JP610]